MNENVIHGNGNPVKGTNRNKMEKLISQPWHIVLETLKFKSSLYCYSVLCCWGCGCTTIHHHACRTAFQVFNWMAAADNYNSAGCSFIGEFPLRMLLPLLLPLTLPQTTMQEQAQFCILENISHLRLRILINAEFSQSNLEPHFRIHETKLNSVQRLQHWFASS